mgnify:FL=1
MEQWLESRTQELRVRIPLNSTTFLLNPPLSLLVHSFAQLMTFIYLVSYTLSINHAKQSWIWKFWSPYRLSLPAKYEPNFSEKWGGLGGPSIFSWRRRSSGKKWKRRRKIPPLDKSFGSIRLLGLRGEKKLCSSSSSFGLGYIRESSIRFVYDDSKVRKKKFFINQRFLLPCFFIE